MIGSVIKKGSTLYVYDEKGRTLCTKSLNTRDMLMGYTGTSFSVRKNNTIYVYDEKGRTLSTKSC